MKKMTLMLGLLTAGLLAAKASAVTTVYDNGLIDGTVDSFTINFGYEVSDSFTLSSTTTVTGAQIGLWTFPGDVPAGLDWAIGTTTYGNDIDSGTTALANTYQSTNVYGYDLYESTFGFSDTLPAGTYWLSIQNATVASGDPVYWDQTNGPSVAFENSIGNLNGYDVPGTDSESFQIFGDAGAPPVPEPVSATLLGLAGAGLVGYAAKRRKNAQA